MGSFFSTAPSSTISSSDLYAELERTRIERHLAIAQLLEQRQRAYQVAKEREKLNWTASGGALTMLFCALSSYKHKNMLHLLPVFPILSYLGYQTHYCYGNKLPLIAEAASKILHENLDQIAPSAISVQDVRSRMNELKQFKQDEEFFL